MFKNFLKKIQGGLRKNEAALYASGLVFSMRTALFHARTKEPNLTLGHLLKIAIPMRSTDWRFLETKFNVDHFVYRDFENIEVNNEDSFADILCKIADTEILYIYSEGMKHSSVAESGNLLLKGIEESNLIEDLIRKEVSKLSYEDLFEWKEPK